MGHLLGQDDRAPLRRRLPLLPPGGWPVLLLLRLPEAHRGLLARGRGLLHRLRWHSVLHRPGRISGAPHQVVRTKEQHHHWPELPGGSAGHLRLRFSVVAHLVLGLPGRHVKHWLPG